MNLKYVHLVNYQAIFLLIYSHENPETKIEIKRAPRSWQTVQNHRRGPSSAVEVRFPTSRDSGWPGLLRACLRGGGEDPGKDVVSRGPWSMNCTTGLVPPGGEGVGPCVPTSSSATQLPNPPESALTWLGPIFWRRGQL